MCSDTGDYAAESWFQQKEKRENYVQMKKKIQISKGDGKFFNFLSFLIFNLEATDKKQTKKRSKKLFFLNYLLFFIIFYFFNKL